MARKDSDPSGAEGPDTVTVGAPQDPTTVISEVWEPTRYAGDVAPEREVRYARAKSDLYAYGQKAVVAGSLVPLANVELHGWADQVESL